MKYALPLLALFAGSHAFAQGGPPLVTDDPGTPGANHWEINIAGTAAISSNESIYSLPYFDINYGWGDHVQLKFEDGFAFGDAPSAFTPAIVGVKARFLDEEAAGVAVSTYPQFTLHGDSGSQFFLPIEAARSFGAFAVNPEVGYLFAKPADAWAYGLVLAYEFGGDTEALAEIHGTHWQDGSGNELLYNWGARYGVNEHLVLLVSAGHTLTTTNGELPHFFSYLGVQLKI